MTLTALSETVEKKRVFRDALAERLESLAQDMPALEESLRLLDGELERLEAELSESREKAEYLERMASIAAIDAWCEAHGETYRAVECAAFSLSDRFEWPAPGYSVITCDFGDGHRGIDISGYGINGKPITAAKGGRVAFSGRIGSYGYCVFLDHGEGLSTRYAHASALACSTGDVVLPGQTIAYVGSTGNSTGPHLHFEVIRNGELQDPFDYLETVQ